MIRVHRRNKIDTLHGRLGKVHVKNLFKMGITPIRGIEATGEDIKSWGK